MKHDLCLYKQFWRQDFACRGTSHIVTETTSLGRDLRIHSTIAGLEASCNSKARMLEMYLTGVTTKITHNKTVTTVTFIYKIYW